MNLMLPHYVGWASAVPWRQVPLWELRTNRHADRYPCRMVMKPFQALPTFDATTDPCIATVDLVALVRHPFYWGDYVLDVYFEERDERARAALAKFAHAIPLLNLIGLVAARMRARQPAW